MYAEMTERSEMSSTFLTATGWGTATRRFLAGDASERRYERLAKGLHTAILMDAPPGKVDSTESFTTIARHLSALGLSPPGIMAEDHVNGFLLLEDLGDDLYSKVIASSPALEQPLYAAAADVLSKIQSHEAPPGLDDLSAADWAGAAALVLSWYAFACTGRSPDSERFTAVLTDLLHRYADGPRTLILRDYHAENLLWLPKRNGVARVGLLDFQLAQMGQPGYDLVSLLQDARRDVSSETEASIIARFCDANEIETGAFTQTYATLGAQRALRILGIFARLCLKNGKSSYIALLPRVWGQLQRNLAHPALADLAAICRDLLPEPNDAMCERITAQCGLHPHR